MNTPRIIDKLAWLRIENQAILTARSYNQSTYYLPGGKRETGENDQAALIREIKEELTVDLLPDTLRSVGLFEAQAHDKPTATVVQMRCYMGDYTGELTASAEIEELAWLHYADRHKVSAVSQLIFDFAFQQGLLR